MHAFLDFVRLPGRDEVSWFEVEVERDGERLRACLSPAIGPNGRCEVEGVNENCI